MDESGHAHAAATRSEGKGSSSAGPLMTIEDVARLLHYSVKTIYKKSARGEIPSLMISSRKRLFSRATIQYWLANKETGNL
jgi:excisionase family DNA binding protein